MSSIQITMTVELDVDLADYALAYGMTEEQAEKDARERLPFVVANTLVPNGGPHFIVGADDAGVTLTGDLAELVDHGRLCAVCDSPAHTEFEHEKWS